MPSFSQKAKERFLAVAILVVVFLAGLLVGLAWPRLFQRGHRFHPAFAAHGAPAFRGGWRGAAVRPGFRRAGPIGLEPVLARRLGLSDQQQKQIRTILDRHRQQADSLLRVMRPKLAAELDSTRTEIRAILTPDQRQRFDRYIQDGRARMLRRFAPRRFGGPAAPGGASGPGNQPGGTP